MAGILVVPGAYGVLTLWLAFYGVWYTKGFVTRVWQPSIQMGALPIWLGMVVYVVYGMGIGFWHGYKPSYFEAYLPTLLAPFMVNAVVVARPPQAMLWLGAASGAILAGCVAAYQSLYLQIGRAIGALNNQIMFGDLAVVLGMFAAFGWLYWGRGQSKLWVKVYLLFGVFMALLASLLSGTKGGWLSILMLAVILVWLTYSHWHWAKRVLVAALVLWAIVLVAYMVPHDLVVNRVVSGLQGGHAWFATGQISDGSVSIRLEKWNQALGMIGDKPLSGWTTEGAIHELGQRLVNVGAGDGWTQTENDLLQAGIVHGLPAIVSYLALYLGLILGFARIRQLQLPNALWVGLSTAGVVLVVLMLEFGLSVVVLGRNAFRHTLIVWSMLLLGYLLLLWQQHCSTESH